jgi:CMP-N,N'-diacetyllegionaminic acid synthase
VKRRLIGVIPARGGSKRIPRKNLALLADKPLLSYSIESAIEAAVCDELIVSSDSPEIWEHASRYGLRVVERPAELARDISSTESVLLHVLDECARAGEAWQCVLTLPPTSPLRSPATIRAFVDHWWTVHERFDAMISVCETRGDFWRRAVDGSLIRLFPDAPRRQQDRQPLYEETSAIYVTKTSALRATGSILGRSVVGWAMDRLEAIDINDGTDLAIAECFLKLRAAASSGAAGPAST